MKVHLPFRKAVFERHTYEAPAEGRAGKIRLDFNENTTGCGAAAHRAIRRLTPKEIAMYPEYEAPTRKIARYFRVRPEEIMLTNGGDDALRVFFDAFVEPRSHILICEPTFPMYRYYAEIAGARVEVLRYGSNMELPVSGLLKALRKNPRLLFLANPNNPTGTLVPKAVIRKLLRAAKHTVVVMDEAYAEFSGVSATPWIREFPHLFVARTFSKAEGLAGLRLGAIIANRDSLGLVRRVVPPFPVNIAALAAGVAAVEEGTAIRRYIREVQRLRLWFKKELAKRNVHTFPSAGNFVLANFGTAGPTLFRKLDSRGILVRERSKDLGPGFARITIGTESELKALLRLLGPNS